MLLCMLVFADGLRWAETKCDLLRGIILYEYGIRLSAYILIMSWRLWSFDRWSRPKQGRAEKNREDYNESQIYRSDSEGLKKMRGTIPSTTQKYIRTWFYTILDFEPRYREKRKQALDVPATSPFLSFFEMNISPSSIFSFCLRFHPAILSLLNYQHIHKDLSLSLSPLLPSHLKYFISFHPISRLRSTYLCQLHFLYHYNIKRQVASHLPSCISLLCGFTCMLI